MNLRRTNLLVLAAGVFLFGLLLGHAYWRASEWMLIFTAVTAALLYRTKYFQPFLILCFLTLGIIKGYAANYKYAALESLMGQKVVMAGVISDDPVHHQNGYMLFSVGSLQMGEASIAGELRTRSRYMKLQRGYRVQMTGRLQPGFGNKQGEIGFSDLKVLSTSQSILERLRQRFFAGMRTALPEPYSELGLGLIVGARALLPKDLQESLQVVGLTHIIAVSGYNLTIIVDLIRKLPIKSFKFAAYALPAWLILAFMVIAGFSASIVRAAVVSGLSLVTSYYGRQIKPMVLIALAAAATAYVRPEYLWQDLGWQLSFLAFFGILVLAPLAQARYIKKPNALKNLFVESMSAHIMTFPLILIVFGSFSVIAPLANVLVLPLIPFAMAASLVAGLAGILAPVLAGWLAWPASLLLRTIVATVSKLATFPWASFDYKVALGTGLVIYALIAVVVIVIWRAKNNLSKEATAPLSVG